MGLNAAINEIVTWIVKVSYDPLMPLMVGFWLLGMSGRVLVYYTVSRQHWFVVEVAKRVDRFVDDPAQAHTTSFFVIVKKVLERSYYELFRLRGIMMRRKHDYVISLTDRVFAIQTGAAMVVKDTLKQVRHLRRDGEQPKMLAISRNVMEGNPCFNKIAAVVPASPINDFLNLLPGLFIIGGIFGTFIGIMSALPRLSTIELEDTVQAKKIIDAFLLDVAFSMGTSIVGVILSVSMSVWNTFLNPEKKFVEAVNRFENVLDILWNRSSDNVIPAGMPTFDEHKDPLSAIEEAKKESPAAKE